jgi:hypothetical protein
VVTIRINILYALNNNIMKKYICFFFCVNCPIMFHVILLWHFCVSKCSPEVLLINVSDTSNLDCGKTERVSRML